MKRHNKLVIIFQTTLYVTVNNAQLSVMYTNADSLFNKMDELQALITGKNIYDIIAVTEVFPKSLQ